MNTTNRSANGHASGDGQATITGADGFIGSHLAELLTHAGYRVRAFVKYNSFGKWGWLDTLPRRVLDRVNVVAGDIRDEACVVDAMRGSDVVFHLAALVSVPYSYMAPRSFIETNVTGTLNVLEAARALGTRRVIHTSTSETYGTAVRVPMDETNPQRSQSPYAASKAAADKLVESYVRSFGLPAVTVRPFNTYGPRQSLRAVIPTIIMQLTAGPRVCLGALDPVRDFTYCLDTVRAFAAVAEAPDELVLGEVFNVGTGAGISVRELAHKLARIQGRELEIETDDARARPAASEVMRLLCDSGKLARAVGWEPKVSLEEGLERAVAWFTDPANLGEYTRADSYVV